MKKYLNRIALGAGTVGIIIAGAAAFSAFEAHVINVTARIENALDVTVDELDFGTVFPQEKLDKDFTVSLSQSFLEAATPTQEPQWASSVESFNQGLRKNGTSVLPERSDPQHALGPAQTTGTPSDPNTDPANFVSLGFGGSIVLGFNNYIVNVGGDEIMDFEVTGGTYPQEKVDVYGSQDCVNFTLLEAGSVRDDQIDLGPLPWAKCVKLVDVSDASLFEATADGYDLDAIRAINQVRLGTVDYVVRQKPKCVDEQGNHPQVKEDGNTFYCPPGSTMMPLLCPYLSKHETTPDGLDKENDSQGISAFHGLPGPWNLATTIATQVWGKLSKPAQDTSDTWNIDLKVPAFRGEAAQDWAGFVQEANPEVTNPDDYLADPADEEEIFGCDVWLEVTGIDKILEVE